MKFLALIVTAMMAAAPQGTEGAFMNSCALQYDCFDVTFEVVPSSYCGVGGGVSRHLETSEERHLRAGGASDCDWEVCMVWNFDKPGCVKESTEQITNVCSRTSDYCSDAYDFSSGSLTFKAANGHKECAIVKANAGASFLVRDQKCTTTGFGAYEVEGGGDMATCGRRTTLGSSIQSCGLTDTNGANRECYWQFPAPPCPAPSQSPSPPPSSQAPSSAPIGDCDCIDHFDVPEGGPYTVVHEDFAGGHEVQILKFDSGNGAIYNEATLAMLGPDNQLELNKDGIFVNGAVETLPMTVGGFTITDASTDTRTIAIATDNVFELTFTSITGVGQMHIDVSVTPVP